MTTGEKALAVIIVGGVLYLMTRRSEADLPPGAVPETLTDRVLEFSGYMLRYGSADRIDPALIAAVITVESSGFPRAVSSAGAVGLMQLLPSTAKWIAGVEREALFSPDVNIKTGTVYLRYLIDRMSNNVSAALCAYNYGPTRISIVGGEIQAPEAVLQYARNVLGLVELYRQLLRFRMGAFYEAAWGRRTLIAGLPCGSCR